MTATKNYLHIGTGVVREYPESLALVFHDLVEYIEDVDPEDLPAALIDEPDRPSADAVGGDTTDQAAPSGKEE